MRRVCQGHPLCRDPTILTGLQRDRSPSALETKVLVDRYRKHYNTVRPHSALGYRPPAPEAFAPWPLSTEVPSPYTGLTL